MATLTLMQEFVAVVLLVSASFVTSTPQAEKKYDQCSHPFHSFLCNPAPNPRNIAAAASNGIRVIDPPSRLPAASFGVKTIAPAPAGSIPVAVPVQPPCEHETTSPSPQKPPLLGASSFARESKLPPVAYLPPKTREGSASSPANTFIQPANLDPPFLAPKPSSTFPQPIKTFPEYKKPSTQTPKPSASDNNSPDCEHSPQNKSPSNRPSPGILAGSSTFESPSKALPHSRLPLVPTTNKPTSNYNPFIPAAQNENPVVAPFPASVMMRPKICDDAFHSFLCQPVDPSKRRQKYGQLNPAGSASLRGDSSFVQPSKVLPPTTSKPSYYTTKPPPYLGGTSFQYLPKLKDPPCNHSDPALRNYPVLRPDSSFVQQTQVYTTKRPTTTSPTTTTTTSKPFYFIPKANYPKPESTFQVQSKVPPPCNGSETRTSIQGNKPLPLQYQTTTKRPTTTTARTTTTTTSSQPFYFGFRGESTFQSPSKVAPPCNHSTPNSFLQQYFPPRSTSPPTTTRRPTTTTTTTTVAPFFFQPKGASTFQTQLKVPPPCNHTKAQPSDPFQQFLRPTTATTRRPTTTTTTTTTTTPRPFYPRGESTFQSSVQVSPPCNDTSHNPLIPKPDSTFIQQSILPLPTINRPTNVDPAYKPQAAEISSVTVDGHDHDHHHGKDICKDPFHSFLCTPVIPSKRKRPTGEIPERLRNAFPNALSGASSFNNPTKVLPSTTARPLTLSDPQQSQLNPFRLFPSSPVSATPVPCEHESHLSPKGASSFLQPSRVPLTDQGSSPQATAQKPSYTADKYQNSPFKTSNQQFPKVIPDRTPQSTNDSPQGYTYPRPDGAGDGSSILGQGYSYPKPQQQFPLGASTFQQPTKVAAPDKVAQGTANSQGYSYPKPPEGTAPQQQGYNYPRPNQQFPFGASSFQQPTKTAAPEKLALGAANTPQGYSYPKPPQNIGEGSVPQQQGYNYPKPANSFPEFGSLKPAATNNANPTFASQKPDCDQDNTPDSRSSPSQFVRRYRGTQLENFFRGRTQ